MMENSDGTTGEGGRRRGIPCLTYLMNILGVCLRRWWNFILERICCRRNTRQTNYAAVGQREELPAHHRENEDAECSKRNLGGKEQQPEVNIAICVKENKESHAVKKLNPLVIPKEPQRAKSFERNLDIKKTQPGGKFVKSDKVDIEYAPLTKGKSTTAPKEPGRVRHKNLDDKGEPAAVNATTGHKENRGSPAITRGTSEAPSKVHQRPKNTKRNADSKNQHPDMEIPPYDKLEKEHSLATERLDVTPSKRMHRIETPKNFDDRRHTYSLKTTQSAREERESDAIPRDMSTTSPEETSTTRSYGAMDTRRSFDYQNRQPPRPVRKFDNRDRDGRAASLTCSKQKQIPEGLGSVDDRREPHSLNVAKGSKEDGGWFAERNRSTKAADKNLSPTSHGTMGHQSASNSMRNYDVRDQDFQVDKGKRRTSTAMAMETGTAEDAQDYDNKEKRPAEMTHAGTKADRDNFSKSGTGITARRPYSTAAKISLAYYGSAEREGARGLNINLEDKAQETAVTIPKDPSTLKRPTEVKEHLDAKRTKMTYDDIEQRPQVRDAEGNKQYHDAEGMTNKDNNEKESKIFQTYSARTKTKAEVVQVINRLHLQYGGEHKFSPADILKLGPPVKQSENTSEKDLAPTFLKTLMTLNYRARYIVTQQKRCPTSRSQCRADVESVDGYDCELDEFFNNPSENFYQPQNDHVHPMDVQMAVFYCSDDFLKQSMVTKLSQCQYALPLLVPDPVTADIVCPLWTFRQIIKTWKKTELKDNLKTVTTKSGPICKAETPLVSFLRLGSMSVSKSELMNTLISERHNTFFHRNCPGNTKTRHLLDGMAEIAWYCPAGKPDDLFFDCVAFCNLHGDSLLVEKQREILTQKSSVVVVLVPTLDRGHESFPVITTLFRSPQPLIILVNDTDCDAVQVKPKKFKLGLKHRSNANVSSTIQNIVGSILKSPHTLFQLESMSKVSGTKMDEDDQICQNGKSAAMEIMHLVQDMDVSKIKDSFLPCQGELWHQWCKINKETYNLRGDIEKEKNQKNQQLKQIRQKQCSTSGGKMMERFTNDLMHLPHVDRKYFLKWTQILVNDMSSNELTLILQKYNDKWSEVLALKRKQAQSGVIEEKQSELELLSKQLLAATFGVEHIFREMAQIYEAHHFLKQQKCEHSEWVKYPELAADLMIAGHPMELMDGDAGHVPLTWISSLLYEVIKKLGDQRVFVLSVLGVQSSGKSTMLNAMFGLQFAVSAGRCTKGAYMQLLQLSEEIMEECKFDYVLVVDTEGLRALELEGNNTLHHDNELATFVVGLANMTLINIFGENPAEMQDILQIVVQAIMRMKRVQLSSSCVFVHQNVTDIAASEKNMEGKRKLQEKLDTIAQLAAKEEGFDAECFSDVIEFDVQEDVKYITQLWEGSPPMAPPNPGYSESIQELKSTILSKAIKSEGIKLSHFGSKIQDLWEALINENFVFSFINTQEVAAYRKLEIHYGNWTWALRSRMLTIENHLHSKIVKGQLSKIALTDLSMEMANTYEETKGEIATFFKKDPDRRILYQWQRQFENKVGDFHDDLLRGVKGKLDLIVEQKRACQKIDQEKMEFEKRLLQNSKELAYKLKDRAADERELSRQFNVVWSLWVDELTRDIKPIKDINLEEEAFLVLHSLGLDGSLINELKSSQRYKNLSHAPNYSAYATQKSSSLTQQIRSLVKDVEQQSLKRIQSTSVATMGYNSTYLQGAAKHVQKQVVEFESQRKFVFKKEFVLDLSLYVFDRASPWLLQSHQIYKDSNDARSYLNGKKVEYHDIFKSFCRGSSSAVVFGEIVCKKLEESASEAVFNQTAIDLATEIRCRFPAFNANRLNLEKHVLMYLAVEEDFDKFIAYIRNPRNQVEEFIKKQVKEYIYKNKSRTLKILKENVEAIFKLIRQGLVEATEKVKVEGGNLDKWVRVFSRSLSSKMTLDTVYCQNFSDISNLDFLKEVILRGLKPIRKEMSSLSLDDVMKCKHKPDEILIDQLCDCCWERCPFCAAVCTNSMKDHGPEKHSAPLHQPCGINGPQVQGDAGVFDFCTTLVTSSRSFQPHQESKIVPYKQYQTAGGKYASWSISADASMQPYWKWFVCRFQRELEHYCGFRFQGREEIPKEWFDYCKEEAVESLC